MDLNTAPTTETKSQLASTSPSGIHSSAETNGLTTLMNLFQPAEFSVFPPSEAPQTPKGFAGVRFSKTEVVG